MTPRLPRSLFALLALGGMGWAAPAETDADTQPKLPAVTGKDLNGKPWKAPAGLPGDRTLVILGYDEAQQATIDTWTVGMGLTQPANTIAWVEMPVIDEPGVVMRWIIDTGMQRGIPDQQIRSHVWTAYTDRAKFLASCGIDSTDDIHVLVVARDGRILALEKGRHTEAAAARLRETLRDE